MCVSSKLYHIKTAQNRQQIHKHLKDLCMAYNKPLTGQFPSAQNGRMARKLMRVTMVKHFSFCTSMEAVCGNEGSGGALVSSCY